MCRTVATSSSTRKNALVVGVRRRALAAWRLRGLAGNSQDSTLVFVVKARRSQAKTLPVPLRLAVEDASRLRKLAIECGRPLSHLLRFAVHKLRREDLPSGWFEHAEDERAIAARATR